LSETFIQHVPTPLHGIQNNQLAGIRFMIIGKIWRSFKAQLNKLANYFWTVDPIAQMQYEYDQAIEQLKGGKEGLAQYRALVERVARQVQGDKKHVAQLESKVKAYLQAGDRETASKFALELQKAKAEMAENVGQLEMHETAYNNNITKIKRATGKVAEIKEKIQKYDAEIKMSRAEAELADLAGTFNFDVTTDLGQIESILQQEIDTNRGKARVSADLSEEGFEEIEREAAVESAMADDALKQFEMEMGMITPQTANVSEATKDLGQRQAETN
jgi:phage shock protein A